MGNFIEKHMHPKVRLSMRTLVAGALGLFLALRYNDYITKLISRFIPEGSSLFLEGILLILITIGIVYLSVWVEKQLDGK